MVAASVGVVGRIVVSGVRVERAGIGDVGEIVGLSAALFREDAGTRDPFTNLGWPVEEGRGYFAAMVGGERSVCLVARVDGGVVGYLAGWLGEGSSLRPVRVADLESTYVVAEQRGRGVGAELVRVFLAWAGDGGAERVSVTAYAANGRAPGFYERLGFRPKSVTLEAKVGDLPASVPATAPKPEASKAPDGWCSRRRGGAVRGRRRGRRSPFCGRGGA